MANSLDMKDWPTISLDGIAYNLPMPSVGESGRWGGHYCTLGDREECSECQKAREKLDDRLVREMKSMRNGPCSRMRVDKEDA